MNWIYQFFIVLIIVTMPLTCIIVFPLPETWHILYNHWPLFTYIVLASSIPVKTELFFVITECLFVCFNCILLINIIKVFLSSKFIKITEKCQYLMCDSFNHKTYNSVLNWNHTSNMQLTVLVFIDIFTTFAVYFKLFIIAILRCNHFPCSTLLLFFCGHNTIKPRNIIYLLDRHCSYHGAYLFGHSYQGIHLSRWTWDVET